ncbi:MAG TPA: DUF3465 domain-containing protein [Coleofasciculaceae cyanobacterium]
MVKGLILFVLTACMTTTGCGRSPAASENSLLSSAVVEDSGSSKYRLQKYPLTDLTVLENAFHQRISNVQVLVLGKVIAVLPDDTNGDRHQRFIVKLSNSQTLLVAHNIDIAPRVDGLRVGDELYIYGEYDWNSQGGVIHWTHHDPNGSHVDGWIERNGQVFQ